VPSRKLPNYLRGCRKGLGLSQKEMAFLLGCRNGGSVSRYERFTREPTLKTALMLEAVLGVAIRELFGGAFEQARQQTARQAQELVEQLRTHESSPPVQRKLGVLDAILNDRHANHLNAYDNRSQ